MFVRYRIDKQVEDQQRRRRPRTRSSAASIRSTATRTWCSATPACSPTARSTSCACSSAATSPTTSCARRSTQPTINRPSGNFGKPSNQPQGRTEDRWQFVNNFSYTLERARLEVRRRLQPDSRHQLLQQQHRRHLHVRHRSTVRCERSDDLSDAVHAEHRRPEPAAAQRRLSACSRRTAGACVRTSR